MWLRDSSIESRIVIASYKHGTAFVILDDARARELEKRPYVRDYGTSNARRETGQPQILD